MKTDEIVEWLGSHVTDKADLRLDSRDIQKGDVFVACAGTIANGLAYISDAIKRGAAAVLADASEAQDAQAPAAPGYAAPVLAVPDLRKRLGELADTWYRRPSEAVSVIAVTGTNGKTSCVTWIAEVLNAAGKPCATIGTLGIVLPDGSNLGGSLTTPDVLTLHRQIAQMRDAGVEYVAMEASSIGIEQGRMDGLRVKVAAFTNLTLDHLDYHQTMARYEAAKAALFHWPGLNHAILNLDDAAGTRIFTQTTAQQKAGYSLTGNPDAAYTGTEHKFRDYGLVFTLHTPQGEAQVTTRLVGEHSIANILLVVAVLDALGIRLLQSAGLVSMLTPVPGRLQTVAPIEAQSGSKLPLVIVDYSHTPDSLERALAALRPVAAARGGKLFCVFGCGGDRDTSKRPIMGRIASDLADRVLVTSDNPRTEQPEAILADILKGMPAGAQAQLDRGCAIIDMVLAADTADVVLVAGKGHETYQEINHVRHPFDDIEWSRLGLLLRSQPEICTDSRNVAAASLFIAIRGEQFDAHDFLADVKAAGAAAALVSRRDPAVELPQILVADTTQALMSMGHGWRRQYAMPLIAVTGSNGKTTTKEMISAILAKAVGADHRFATQGNLNNQWGVPRSLLALRPGHALAVLELGMNHPGEIAQLAAITEPSIAVVTNAQREHQEFMRTVDAVAQENGEVFQYLRSGGTAVFPADEPYVSLWQAQAQGRRILTFGLSGASDFSAEAILADPLGTSFVMKTPVGAIDIRLSIAGVHNVRNSLAAAACAHAAGIGLAQIREGLQAFSPVKGRMRTHTLVGGITLIDDSYNANPDSVIAAINVLAALPGPTVLVLGDMAEVGENGPQMHREVGLHASGQAIAHVFTFGQASRLAAEAFGSGAQHVSDIQDIAGRVAALKPASILVKGSRSMRMERVVQDLLSWSEQQGEKHAI